MTTSKAFELFQATDAVIGQVPARKLMAALLDRQWQVHQGILERSSGALLVGFSGSGKTYLSRMMCQHLGLPYAEADATRYTEGGYKGLDLPQIFIPLLEEAARIKDGLITPDRIEALGKPVAKPTSVLKRPDIDEVVEIAQTGVILLDEMDKWMLRVNRDTGQVDKSIQSELLKMIEGSIEYVSDSDEEVGIHFDTSRVLIICAGAFVGLFAQVKRRLHMDGEEKDVAQQEGVWNQTAPEDFVKFGLLPELAGRLSRHIFTRPLRVNDLRAILSRDGGLLEEYRTRFEAYGCEWAVSEAGEIRIAQIAIERDTGARALEHVMSKKFDLALFEAAVAEVPVKVVLEPSMDKAEVRPQ
jgi:ATP-dependent Clp protease ATP-binding subunit ClpX